MRRRGCDQARSAVRIAPRWRDRTIRANGCGQRWGGLPQVGRAPYTVSSAAPLLPLQGERAVRPHLRTLQEAMREEDVPAEQPEAQEDPRLSGSYAHSRRTGADRPPASQGTQPPVGLIWRVRDRASFRALAAGRRHRWGALTMTRVRTAESGPPRVAFAIGRHVVNAVVRNRVRRRLRALAHQHATSFAPGHAYLIGAAPRAHD